MGKAIEYAKALGVPQLNCLAGIVPQGRDARRRAAPRSSRTCASPPPALGAKGLRLLIEPINTYDIPGFFLSAHASRRSAIIDASRRDNLFLQYDIYHMQRMEGELANTIKTHLPRIGHLQLADNPGRNEPGTGEINYPFLFAPSTRSATTAGSAASTSPRPRPAAGPRRGSRRDR